MEERLDMSKKDRKKAMAMEILKQGKGTVGEMAHFLDLSPRQVRRLCKRYREGGVKGLLHGNRGHSPVNKIAVGTINTIKDLYRSTYNGFGPTHFSEVLARRESIMISAETARRILNEAKLNKKRRRHKQHRERRPRREHFGELVQLDGSFHQWYGPGGAYCCMMVMVDDATGTAMSMMSDQETMQAAFQLLLAWIEKYGVPRAIYCDRKTLFFLPREATLEEELAGEEPLSEFGRACREVDIELIKAYSPQAKGRVERRHGTHQDRLLNEFRLAGIKDNVAANHFLKENEDELMNKKLSVPAASSIDYHRRAPSREKLLSILCESSERKVANDWVIRDQNEFFQITKDNRPLPRPHDSVIVKRQLDGEVVLECRGRKLAYRKIVGINANRIPRGRFGVAPVLGGFTPGSADSALRYAAQNRETPTPVG